MRSSHLFALCAVVVLISLTQAGAQIPGITLPAGEGLPTSWTPTDPLFPTPEKWSAQISWAITNPEPGVLTYWYRVDHLGAGPLTPVGGIPQAIKSVGLVVDPAKIQQIAGVFQYGHYEESPPNAAGQSVSANPVIVEECKVEWTNFYLGVPFNSITSGETVYLWLRSTFQPSISPQWMSLQDGSVGQTHVPSPGFCGEANICGKAYCDDNNNGVKDDNEPAFPNVLITLKNPNGDELGTTVTDGDGNYCFTGLDPGDYVVVGPNTASGRILISGAEIAVSVAPYQSVTVDFLYQGGLIDGYVFCDEDGDKVKGATEPGIAGVTIKLSNGAETTTDANGYYAFGTCLEAGTYTITAPLSFDGKDILTSDTIQVTIDEGGESHDNNFGYECCVSKITGVLFCDKNYNGVKDADEDVLPGVTITLKNFWWQTKGTTVTDSNGAYEFSGLSNGIYFVIAPETASGLKRIEDCWSMVWLCECKTVVRNIRYKGGKISGYVCCDEQSSKDGCYSYPTYTCSYSSTSVKTACYDCNDSCYSDDGCGYGHKPLPGVTITLSNGQTAVTDANGYYSFRGCLPAGQYTITAPATFDGKPLKSAGSITVTLGAGGSSSNNNFEYRCCVGTIKGKLYCDDGSECSDCYKALGGVTVQLKNSAGAVVATDETNSSGYYSFTGLAGGTYIVSVPNPANGLKLCSASSVCITLNECDTRSASFKYKGASVSGVLFCDSNCNGVKDYYESGLYGATVTLKSSTGEVIATAKTDSCGYYVFNCCLPAGSYKVYAPSCIGYKYLKTTNPLSFTLSAGQNLTGRNFGYR